eukprot:Hpha_TRINITY_DN16560_c2_g10::TRINITY_DN16560_c2_g10_i1::g.133701::m.133701/K10365/CAPZB; capping protein (actin filament) muscle Z-line, beta
MKPLAAALELVKAMPPAKIGDTLVKLAKLQPDILDDLLSEVDQPLKSMTCESSGRSFIICDHNRDGDSFRSPWSNNYYPEYDGFLPSRRMRALEIASNEMFDGYRDAYYGRDSLSSAYFWDDEEAGEQGFAAAIVIRKEVKEEGRRGVWDSIHVLSVESEEDAKKKGDGKGKPGGGKPGGFSYTLTSSILVHIADSEGGGTRLAGRVQEQFTEEMVATSDEQHLVNIGDLVQRRENKMRDNLALIYFGKSQEVINELRSQVACAAQSQGGIAAALKERFGK